MSKPDSSVSTATAQIDRLTKLVNLLSRQREHAKELNSFADDDILTQRSDTSWNVEALHWHMLTDAKRMIALLNEHFTLLPGNKATDWKDAARRLARVNRKMGTTSRQLIEITEAIIDAMEECHWDFKSVQSLRELQSALKGKNYWLFEIASTAITNARTFKQFLNPPCVPPRPHDAPTNERSSTQMPSEKKPQNGPSPPNHFYWNGIVVNLEPTPWKLLNCVWQSRRMHITEVENIVWGSDNTRDGSLKAALHRVGKALMDSKTGLSISKRGEWIVLA